MPLPQKHRETVLQGIVAASLTPITERGGIDTQRLSAHISMLLSQGCSFVSTFGSTGEGPSFSTRQKVEALQELATLGIDLGRIIPAVMCTSADDAVVMLNTSADLGCRATLIVPPFYFTPARNDGIAAFFNHCAQDCGGHFPTDIILYHIPQMTRVPFDTALIETLLDRHDDRLVAIKDSTGDIAHALMLRRTFPDLAVFTGDDRVLPSLLAAGGAGMIGGLPNVTAPDLVALFADHAGAKATALAVQAQLRIEAVERHGGIAALRALKASQSNDQSWLRSMAPLQQLPRSDWQALSQAFAESAPI